MIDSPVIQTGLKALIKHTYPYTGHNGLLTADVYTLILPSHAANSRSFLVLQVLTDPSEEIILSVRGRQPSCSDPSLGALSGKGHASSHVKELIFTVKKDGPHISQGKAYYMLLGRVMS